MPGDDEQGGEAGRFCDDILGNAIAEVLLSPSEILENGKFGLLVPVCEDEAMAGAITSTLDAPIDSMVLRERAASFSVERAIDRYETLGLGAVA